MSEYNQKNAYQQNVSQQNQQPQQFTTRDIMAGIYQMAQYDAAGAQEEMMKFQAAQANPQSQWYDPYSAPTNRAVSNLAAYGFDTNNLTDDWFNRNNGWIASNLLYNGTTNSPSKPGKKATRDQQIAYELYQYQKSEDATRKAEQQWDALQQELTYLAQDTSRNYSDEDIMKMIDWSKYKELTSMDDNKYYQPNEYNRAIGYSKDAMYGVLWKARNPEYEGDIYGAMANSTLGNGNVWQDNPEITAKLNWNNADTYSPFSVGMTAGEEGRYFGVYSFGDKEIEMLQNRLDPRTGEPLDPNDATAMKMRDNVLSAYETTNQAKRELGVFLKKLDEKLEDVTDPEDAQKIVEDLLDSEVYDKETKESITFDTLKNMDASLNGSPDSLVKTTDAVDYRKQDMIQYALDKINANAGKETGTDVQDGISSLQGDGFGVGSGSDGAITHAAPKTTETEASIAKSQDSELKEVKSALYDDAGEMEQAVMDNGWSVTYDGVKNAWDNLVNYGRAFVDNLATKVKDSVLSDHTDDTLSTLQSMYDYDMRTENIQRMELRRDELQKKYGNALLIGQEPESEVSRTITVDGEKYQIFLSNNYTRDGSYTLDAADQFYNGDTFGVQDEETWNKILGSDEYRKAVEEESAKAQAIAKANEAGSGYTEEYLKEAQEAANELRSLDLQIEDAKLANAQDEQKYQKDQKAFDAAQRKLDQQIYVMNMLGMDTSDLEEYQDTIAYLTNFSDYEATVWSAYNPNDAYRIALAEGEDRDAVYEAAKKGNDQIVAELEIAKARRKYIEDHNLNVPGDYLNNLDRHIAKLERNVRDYEDFLLSKNDDWDEMVAKGRQEEYDNRPKYWWKFLDPSQGWSYEDYYSNMDNETVDLDNTYAGYGLRKLAGPLTKQMTQEEKDTYYYLMGKGEEERAREYVKSLTDMSYGVLHTRYTEDVRKQTEGMLREQKSQDFATKEEADKWVEQNGKKFKDYQMTEDENGYHISWSQSTGALGFIGANALAIIASPAAAMSSLGYIGYSLLSGDEINPDNAMLMLNTFRSTTREQSAKEIADYYGEGTFMQKAVQMFYEMVSNRLDSAMNGMMFGNIFGGVGNEMLQEFLGASPMGFSAAMDAMMEAKRKGASDAQAWGIGFVTFIAETGTEAISLDNMKKAFKLGEEVTGEGIKAFLKEWLTQGGISEMLGESANDVIENLADELIMGELSDHKDRVWAYRMQNYSKEDAEAMARRDEIAGVLRTAFMSYLSPGMDIVSYGVGRADYYRQKTKQLQQAGINTSTFQVAKAEREARIEEQRAADEAVNDELGSFDLEAVDEELARREARDREAEITENGVENGEGSFRFVGGEPAFQQEDADIDVSQLQSKTNPEQTATPAESAKVDIGTQYNALESVKNADTSSQSATIASVLDTAKTEESADIANAATMKLGEMLGEDGNPAEFVQDMLLGADVEGVDAGQVMQAIQNASLGGENSAAWQLMQTDEFKNADYGEQAAMLAETVETDSANQALGQQMQNAVHDYLVAQAEKELLKDGTFNSVNQARKAQNDAREATISANDAQRDLEIRRGELQAAEGNRKAADDLAIQEPSLDHTKEAKDAQAKLISATAVEQEYEQSAQNAEAEKQEAIANAKSAQETARKELRQQAEAMVADRMQQRQERLAQEAEQQRIADEQAAQAQAEEDQRSGKKAEVDTQKLAEDWANQMHLEGEERDAFIKRVVERQEQKALGKIDMTGKVSNAEGYLAINAFARKTGLNFQLSDTLPKGTRGAYSNGVVYLNAEMVRSGQMTIGQALVEAALHEMTHSMQESKNYKNYRRIVLGSLFGAEGNLNIDHLYNTNADYRAAVKQKLVDYQQVKPNMTRAEAEQEVVADFARLHLAEKDVVQRFMDAGLGGRMRNTLHNINQALKNFYKGLKGEDRKQAEYLRRAERAYQKALDEVARTQVHPEGEQFSIMQVAQATGMTFDEKKLELRDKYGNIIDGVEHKLSTSDIEKTPVGYLIRNGLDLFDGKNSKQASKDPNYIDPTSTAGKAMDMMTGLMNMIARYKQSDLVWEIGASTLTSTFSALKSNSDTQYQTTVDFGTICAKTQAIIDVMSQVMMDKIDPETGMLKEGMKAGLTRKEIMKIYDATHHADLSVPCPVCYVFSRWMGVPSLLGQMSQFQKDYVVTKKDANGKPMLDKNGRVVIDWDATQKVVDDYLFGTEPGKEGMLVKYKDKDAINDKKTSLQNKLKSLEEKKNDLEKKLRDSSLSESEKENIKKQIDETLNNLVDVEDQLGEVRAFNWVTQALCLQKRKGNSAINVVENGHYVLDKKFMITPDNVLFDLNRTSEFAEDEKNWSFRNTRGAGMGKSIMPYSGETIGDMFYNGKGKRQNGLKNPWLNFNYESDGKNSAALRQMNNARGRAKQQNLLGGQRLQSTSDFRPEWGLDYIMSFLELQAAGSKVQMYTKVAEAVDFFASVGADVNLSIMGQGTGWHEATEEELNKLSAEERAVREIKLGDKTYLMDFSKITGMEYFSNDTTRKTATSLKNAHNNVQMILVGMNDTHIRLAMRNGNIDFIIPWHSSGNSKEILSGLISAVDESLNTSVDYTTTQSDMRKGEKKTYYDENGEKVEYSAPGEQTEQEKHIWDLRMRILTGKADNTPEKGGFTAEERREVSNDPWLGQLYERFYTKGVDDSCYHVKLSGKQAKQIFPYEYWDTSLTKDQADENGRRFVKYCERMGVIPRFSQFKDEPGYWKLLIDRPMYNNDKTYHEQQTINVTNARIGSLDESGKLDKSTTDLPTQAQAKYAPKDKRNPMYEEYRNREKNAVKASEEALGMQYTEKQEEAMDDADALQNDVYRDGVDKQYSVYGDMTDSDIDQMLAGIGEEFQDAVKNGDIESAKEDFDFSMDYPASDISQTEGMPAQVMKNGLVAVHNLTVGRFMKVLNLKGFVYPSIAILPKDREWGAFTSGEAGITVFFGRKTVDPNANGEKGYGTNRMYTGDAYTPMFDRNSPEFGDAEAAAAYLKDQPERVLSGGGADDSVKWFSSMKRIGDVEQAREYAYRYENLSEEERKAIRDEAYEKRDIALKAVKKRVLKRLTVTNRKYEFYDMEHFFDRAIFEIDEEISNTESFTGNELSDDQIAEIVNRNLNIAAMNSGLKDYKFSSDVVDPIMDYINYTKENLFSEWMEAKAFRVAGLDEAMVINVPKSISADDYQKILDAGFPEDRIRMYDNSVSVDSPGGLYDTNRQIANEVEGVAFSAGGELTDADIDHRLAEAGIIPPAEPEMQYVNKVPEENTYRELEGQNPMLTTGAPGPQRAFGSKDGMLAQSDEIDRRAKAYVMNQDSYVRDSNPEQVERAIQWIHSNKKFRNSDGFVESMEKITGRDFDYRSADGQARMVAMMGMAVARNDIMAQVQLADAFNRQGTDLGRALQARKLFRLMTPDGRISMLQKLLHNTEEDTGIEGLNFSDWIYRAAASASEEGDFEKVYNAAAAELAEQIPATWKDKIVGWRMLSMLGNPRTHIRNVMGNAMFIPMVGLKNKIGALGEIAFRLKPGERTKTLGFANKESRDFANHLVGRVESELRGEAKYNDQNAVKQAQKIWGTGKGIISRTLGKVLQGLSDFNSNALEWEDWVFLKGHFKRAFAGYMTANKYTAADMKGETLKKATEYAILEAHKATYRDANSVATALNNFAKRTKGTSLEKGAAAVQFAVNAVLPFKKTPANILKRGIEYSPAGLISAATDIKDMIQTVRHENNSNLPAPKRTVTPSQFIDKIASSLTGTGVMILGAVLGSLGAANAGFDDDDPEDRLKKLEGEQEYGVNFGKALNAITRSLAGVELFGEDCTRTMDWAAPFSMPFFVGVAVQKQLSKEHPDLAAGDIINAMLGITEPVFNLSMLDGVNSLFNVSQNDPMLPATQIGMKILLNYGSSFVPTLLGQAARIVDPTRRMAFVQSGKKPYQVFSTFESVQNKIPGASKLNIPYRNPYGEAEMNGSAAEVLFAPWYKKEIKGDAITKEIRSVFSTTTEVHDKIIPEVPPRYYQQGAGTEPYRLTDQEYNQVCITVGETGVNLLNELIQSDEYKMSSPDTKAMMMEDVWSYANKKGRQTVLPDTNLDTWMANGEKTGNMVNAIVNKTIETKMKEYTEKRTTDLIHSLERGDETDVQTIVTEMRDALKINPETIRKYVSDYFRPMYYESDYDGREEIKEILYGLDIGYKKQTFSSWDSNADKEDEPEEEREDRNFWLNMEESTESSAGGGGGAPLGAWNRMTEQTDSGGSMPQRPESDDDWDEYMDDLDNYWHNYDFELNDPVGQYGLGTIDMNNRKVVNNPDGSISTERSFSFYDRDSGKEVLIPLIVDGKVLTQKQAIDHYYETVRQGKPEYLGMFDNEQDADEYAVMLHNRGDWYYHQ